MDISVILKKRCRYLQHHVVNISNMFYPQLHCGNQLQLTYVLIDYDFSSSSIIGNMNNMIKISFIENLKKIFYKISLIKKNLISEN